MQRRDFFQRVLQGIVALPLSWMGATYVFPSWFDSRSSLVKVSLGTVDELFAGRSYYRCQVADIPVLLIRQNDQIRAIDVRCTHAQCTTQLADDQQRIVCPCHGGAFGLDGSVISGPPKKPLQQLFVSVHDGKVILSNRVIPS